MKTIYKYELSAKTELNLPIDATILTIAEQGNKIFAWVLLDKDVTKVNRTIVAIGTGHIVPDNWVLSFISTLDMKNGTNIGLVFHFFELLSE